MQKLFEKLLHQSCAVTLFTKPLIFAAPLKTMENQLFYFVQILSI
jgi:hypothetical protein